MTAAVIDQICRAERPEATAVITQVRHAHHLEVAT